MRAKIHYYVRFVFGLSQGELKGLYSLFLLLLCYVLVTLYVKFEEDRRVMDRFEPEVWNSALVKLPKARVWVDYVKAVRDIKPWEGKNGYRNKFKSQVYPLYVKKLGQLPNWSLDINLADSTAWVGLKGIGPGFAKRIITYRDRLGGFNAVQQLKEVYGLDSVWVEENKSHFKIGDGVFRTLKINQLAWNEFRHPYLPYTQVKLFLSYRKQHPTVVSFDALASIRALDMEVWNRLKPYLSFEP
jgi:hypothetical protein